LERQLDRFFDGLRAYAVSKNLQEMQDIYSASKCFFVEFVDVSLSVRVSLGLTAGPLEDVVASRAERYELVAFGLRSG
jgi:hypothetical protein